MTNADGGTDDWVFLGYGMCTDASYQADVVSLDDCKDMCETFHCDMILWEGDDLACNFTTATSCKITGLDGEIWEYTTDSSEPTFSPTSVFDPNVDTYIFIILLGAVFGVLCSIVHCRRLCWKRGVPKKKKKKKKAKKTKSRAVKDPLFIALENVCLESHYQILSAAGWKLDALLKLKSGVALQKTCGFDSRTANLIYQQLAVQLMSQRGNLSQEQRGKLASGTRMFQARTSKNWNVQNCSKIIDLHDSIKRPTTYCISSGNPDTSHSRSEEQTHLASVRRQNLHEIFKHGTLISARQHDVGAMQQPSVVGRVLPGIREVSFISESDTESVVEV